MEQQYTNPIEAINGEQVVENLHWLILTPFPAPVVIFGVLTGLLVIALGWRQPQTRKTHGLIGLSMVALSLIFWLCLAAAILSLLTRRGPGWAYRNR